MWASAYDCAVVLIGHLNKKEGTKDLYRSIGSVDVVAAARSVVANEKAIREQEANKLESDKIAIGYAEIKEKVVERQLAFQSEVPVKQDELRSNPTS